MSRHQASIDVTKMFKLAEAWGMTPPRRNPALSIRRYKVLFGVRIQR